MHICKRKVRVRKTDLILYYSKIRDALKKTGIFSDIVQKGGGGVRPKSLSLGAIEIMTYLEGGGFTELVSLFL